MNMTPADAMLYMVIAASIAILVYVKFGKRDSRGQVQQRKIKGTDSDCSKAAYHATCPRDYAILTALGATS